MRVITDNRHFRNAELLFPDYFEENEQEHRRPPGNANSSPSSAVTRVPARITVPEPPRHHFYSIYDTRVFITKDGQLSAMRPWVSMDDSQSDEDSQGEDDSQSKDKNQ